MLLEQRRDGVLGSPAQRERRRALEHAVYRPGASVDAESELSTLLARLQAENEALDRAVAASGMLEPDTTARPGSAARSAGSGAAGAGGDPAESAAESDETRTVLTPARGWWTRTRILTAALAVVAAAALAVSIVQVATPRSSLEVFAQPAEPADAGRSDFVNQVLLQGVMGTGPVRYLGEHHGVRLFAALVGDTFHNPVDPQEGVCLTGFLGSDRLDSSTTNCALRDDFDRLGVAVFFTESSTGELEASSTGEATQALVWGPTGGVREVDGVELERLVAAGCAHDNLSFRAREDCVG